MASLDDHPTVRRAREAPRAPTPSGPLSAARLKAIALEQGADDAGLVEISRPALQDQVGYIREVYAGTKTLLSFCVRMNTEPVRSPVRSVANQEFHAVYDEVNETARKIVSALAEAGVPSCNSVAAFPMEVQLPARAWMVAHKPVAVAAGLGRMGIHRSVIHPRFGSFVLLGTVLVGAEADAYDQPLDYNPCLECKLCVAACPVGALKPDGAFDLFTCYTHNYREFLGNFSDFVGAAVESRDMTEFRERFSAGETNSIWQSLSFKPGYKAAYCIAVCPAMEVSSIASFVAQLRLGFQRGRANGVKATYHWTFSGKEQVELTVCIADQQVSIQMGHVGDADVRITADTGVWLRVLNHQYALAKAIEKAEVQVHGDRALFEAFGRCFPR